jgi:hypothetical protein
VSVVYVRGKPHAMVALRVQTRDARGRPSLVQVGYDDTVFDLDDPMQENDFYTGLVPATMTSPRPEKASQ